MGDVDCCRYLGCCQYLATVNTGAGFSFPGSSLSSRICNVRISILISLLIHTSILIRSSGILILLHTNMLINMLIVVSIPDTILVHQGPPKPFLHSPTPSPLPPHSQKPVDLPTQPTPYSIASSASINHESTFVRKECCGKL